MKNEIIESLKADIKENISEKRQVHIKGVTKVILKLAEKYGVDFQDAMIVALGHDITKEKSYEWHEMILKKHYKDDIILEQDKHIWHGFTAVVYLQEKYGITDPSILHAIQYHTIGYPDFDNLGKILYIADFVEPTRNFPEVQEVRKHLGKELDVVLFEVHSSRMEFLLEKDKQIPEDSLELLYMLKNMR